MAGVSVEQSAVAGAISLCNQSIESFKKTGSNLVRSYQQAGGSWKDSKYKQLGSIVSDCKSALDNPISELESCRAKLEALLAAIIEYESTNL